MRALPSPIIQIGLSILGLMIIGVSVITWLGWSVSGVYAQCPTGSTKAFGGLVSAFSIDPNFGSSGCVSGSLSYIPVNQARIVVSDYQALYNKYYLRNSDVTKIVLVQDTYIANGSLGVLEPNTMLYKQGDLILGGAALQTVGSGNVLVFFVDGNLNITADITESRDSQNGGVVFVVKKNVNIDVSVRYINAVIISGGVICSACDENGDMSNDTAPFTDPQLIINGSLIALDPTQNIDFTREYNTNIEPAEIINAQAKYLVILDDIFGERVKIYKEI